MDDLTLSEVRALIRLVKRDLKYRQANVSIENLYSLESKLTAIRRIKQAHKESNNG